MDNDKWDQNRKILHGIYQILSKENIWSVRLNGSAEALTINSTTIADVSERGINVGYSFWHNGEYNGSQWYRDMYLTPQNVRQWLTNLYSFFNCYFDYDNLKHILFLFCQFNAQNEVEPTEKPKLPPQDNSNSNSNSNSNTNSNSNSSTNNTKPKVKHYYYSQEERKQIGELLSKYSKELYTGEYPLMYEGKWVISSTGNINNNSWYTAKTGVPYDWSMSTKILEGFKSVHLSTENILEFVTMLENVFDFQLSNEDKQIIDNISGDKQVFLDYNEDVYKDYAIANIKFLENTMKLQQCKIEEKPHKGEIKMKNSKIMKMMAMQQMMGNNKENNTFDPTMLLYIKDDLDLSALGIKTGNVPNSGVGLNGEVIINDTAINFDEKDEPIMTTGVGELKIDIELIFIPCDIKQLNKKDIIQLDDDYVIVREVTGNKIYGTTIKGYEVAHTLSNNIMGMSYVSKVVNPLQGFNNDNNSFNPMLFALLGDE